MGVWIKSPVHPGLVPAQGVFGQEQDKAQRMQFVAGLSLGGEEVGQRGPGELLCLSAPGF